MSSAPDIEGIWENWRDLDRLRKEQEDVLSEINKMHKKLQASPEIVEKPGDASIAKLSSLYIQARDLSESEYNVSHQLLNQLDALLPSGPPGQQRRRIIADSSDQKRKRMKLSADGSDQKRKRTKSASEITRFTAQMRNQLEAYASLKGEQVAARVTGDNAEKDEWFVVKVMQFDHETKEFEVLDEEPGVDEESSGQKKYKLPVSCIIPFPKRNDPSGVPDFPAGRHVLAVYPGTTALYKATVVSPPRKRKASEYLLEFDDDEEDGTLPQRAVPFYYVVALPENHRQ